MGIGNNGSDQRRWILLAAACTVVAGIAINALLSAPLWVWLALVPLAIGLYYVSFLIQARPGGDGSEPEVGPKPPRPWPASVLDGTQGVAGVVVAFLVIVVVGALFLLTKDDSRAPGSTVPSTQTSERPSTQSSERPPSGPSSVPLMPLLTNGSLLMWDRLLLSCP